jgi:hypothetical protein
MGGTIRTITLDIEALPDIMHYHSVANARVASCRRRHNNDSFRLNLQVMYSIVPIPAKEQREGLGVYVSVCSERMH